MIQVGDCLKTSSPGSEGYECAQITDRCTAHCLSRLHFPRLLICLVNERRLSTIGLGAGRDCYVSDYSHRRCGRLER